VYLKQIISIIINKFALEIALKIISKF